MNDSKSINWIIILIASLLVAIGSFLILWTAPPSELNQERAYLEGTRHEMTFDMGASAYCVQYSKLTLVRSGMYSICYSPIGGDAGVFIWMTGMFGGLLLSVTSVNKLKRIYLKKH